MSYFLDKTLINYYFKSSKANSFITNEPNLFNIKIIRSIPLNILVKYIIYIKIFTFL